jgi:hypothetical protein
MNNQFFGCFHTNPKPFLTYTVSYNSKYVQGMDITGSTNDKYVHDRGFKEIRLMQGWFF